MKVVIVGGTGFLGYHAARELLHRGHQVTAIGLPPLPQDDSFAEQVRIVTKNIDSAPENELRDLFDGQDALVFAAGVDDRVNPPKPAYPFFHHANVEVTNKVLNLAKQAGIKRVVVLGSYFAHFNRVWPEMKLAEQHPYIRSRMEQEQACFALSAPEFEVMVLELPYIFGSMTGRKPLWVPLVNMVRSSKTVYFSAGGTNCVSVKSVAGAVEKGQGGQAYVVGDENLSWEQMFQGFARALGKEVQVVTLPNFVVTTFMFFMFVYHWLKGIESGLDTVSYVKVQTANTFFDLTPAQMALGNSRGGLEQAFKDTVEACV